MIPGLFHNQNNFLREKSKQTLGSGQICFLCYLSFLLSIYYKVTYCIQDQQILNFDYLIIVTTAPTSLKEMLIYIYI